MKTIIIYASTHHGNTKKVVEQLAGIGDTTIVDITREKAPDISSYDVVGFASGVYFHSFHEAVKKFIQDSSVLSGKKVFLLDTCGIAYIDYTSGVKKLLKSKQAVILGSFQCRGYDTYGIFGKLGGIAKNHPNDKDFQNAAAFFRQVTQA